MGFKNQTQNTHRDIGCCYKDVADTTDIGRKFFIGGYGSFAGCLKRLMILRCCGFISCVFTEDVYSKFGVNVGINKYVVCSCLYRRLLFAYILGL